MRELMLLPYYPKNTSGNKAFKRQDNQFYGMLTTNVFPKIKISAVYRYNLVSPAEVWMNLEIFYKVFFSTDIDS